MRSHSRKARLRASTTLWCRTSRTPRWSRHSKKEIISRLLIQFQLLGSPKGTTAQRIDSPRTNSRKPPTTQSCIRYWKQLIDRQKPVAMDEKEKFSTSKNNQLQIWICKVLITVRRLAWNSISKPIEATSRRPHTAIWIANTMSSFTRSCSFLWTSRLNRGTEKGSPREVCCEAPTHSNATSDSTEMRLSLSKIASWVSS